MIVFDLQCSGGHVFEAWFASSTTYEDQRARGLLSCPVCGDDAIGKALMAPAVAPKGNQRAERGRSLQVVETERPGTEMAAMTPEQAVQLRAVVEKLAKAQAEVLKDSQWVGGTFAERARAMHYGEEPSAPIHGVTDKAEAQALIEEGVAVAPLPLPIVPPQKQN